MTRHVPPAFIALFVAYGLGIVGALGDLPRSPPHEAQLFFADHFVRDWWNQLDPRWYGGVDVTVVPLVHAQLAALFAKIPGLGVERAYAAVLVLAAASFGLGVVRLARSLSTERTWFVVAAAASPLVWLTLIPGGRTAPVLALGFALNAVASLKQASTVLEEVTALALAAGAVAAELSGAATLFLLAPLWLSTSPRRIALLISGSALGLLASWSALTSSASVLSDVNWPWSRWVSLSVAAASAVWLLIRREKLAAVTAVLGCLAAGLASLIPISIETLALVISSVSLSLVASTAVPRRVAFMLACAAFITTAATLGIARNHDTRSRRAALREVEWVLANVTDGDRFRFLPLGVGSEWLELSRRVRPHSMDGGLAGTSWDTLNLETDGRTLAALLSRDDAAIRWVISGTAGAQALLEPLGFVSVGAWRGNVTLWERSSTKPLAPQAIQRVRTPWRVGVLSPLCGAAALIVLLLGLTRLLRQNAVEDPVAGDGKLAGE